jgi:predicted Zn-dependent peptidase
VAPLVAAALLYGRDDPRGRPAEGDAATVARLTLADVKAAAPRLLHPRGAILVVAGDFDLGALRQVLSGRLGGWRPTAAPPPAPPPPLTAAASPARLVLVDRPGAPQTVILGVRPLAPVDETTRAARRLAGVALGGSFTSRLMQSLREKHGYTYGARCAIAERTGQPVLQVSTSVQTEVTGPALLELRAQLDLLGSGGMLPAEAAKARETARSEVAARLGTSGALAGTLLEGALAGRLATALSASVASLDLAEAALVDAQARSGAFSAAGLTVVLVGDKKAVLPQLEKAGLPAPLLLDAEGRPAK